MGEQLQEYWLLAIIAAVVAILVLWWLLAASRRTRVEIARRDEEDTPAKRNQALIDAPPAVSSATPVTIPPVMSGAVGGVGEAIEAAVAPPAHPVTSAEGDDLTRIKGLGPRLADQLRALGVTRYEQIAAWDDAEIDRVDAQLGRFQGRIRRDDWVSQARLLGAGDQAAYEAKFGKL